MTIEQLKLLVRKNVMALSPYSSARDEFEGTASVYLDANENPFDTGYNRYPDPHQKAIKGALAEIKKIQVNQIFLGNGSDEAIDLLIRMFCQPGVHNVLIPQPTYGMYKVSADINEVTVKTISLTSTFDLDPESVLKNVDSDTRIIFLCSPNNPSGNLLSAKSIENVLNSFHGMVVVDEAYIDFTGTPSWISKLPKFNNLIVLQTFSKAWGLAGLRLGMAFAHSFVIEMMNKIKPPYNINGLTQKIALEYLAKPGQTNAWVRQIVKERIRLAENMAKLSFVLQVFPSDANFLLIRMTDARKKYDQLLAGGVVVRDRSNVKLCNDCLRITVGTGNENDLLLEALKKL
jgi:histidinol-phosphate aminotransferase